MFLNSKYYKALDDKESLVAYDYELGVFVEINYKTTRIDYSIFRHGEKYGEPISKHF